MLRESIIIYTVIEYRSVRRIKRFSCISKIEANIVIQFRNNIDAMKIKRSTEYSYYSIQLFIVADERMEIE